MHPVIDKLPMKITGYYCPTCSGHHLWPSKLFYSHYESAAIHHGKKGKPKKAGARRGVPPKEEA